jgi:hypothetical protein
MTDDDLGGNGAGTEHEPGDRREMQHYDVIHVERAFSAQPTLSDALGPSAVVHELPLAEALANDLDPDLVWASDATADLVHLLREHFPDAQLLATLPRTAGTKAVLALLAEGADLVLRDEGVLLAAAALQAMARRRRPRASQPRTGTAGPAGPRPTTDLPTPAERRPDRTAARSRRDEPGPPRPEAHRNRPEAHQNRPEAHQGQAGPGRTRAESSPVVELPDPRGVDRTLTSPGI